jgi:hypothetical protein
MFPKRHALRLASWLGRVDIKAKLNGLCSGSGKARTTAKRRGRLLQAAVRVRSTSLPPTATLANRQMGITVTVMAMRMRQAAALVMRIPMVPIIHVAGIPAVDTVAAAAIESRLEIGPKPCYARVAKLSD